MMKVMTIFGLTIAVLSGQLAFASSKLDVAQFVGQFESIESKCSSEIQIVQACDGLALSELSYGQEIARTEFCRIDQGWETDFRRSSSGNGMVISLDYTKARVSSVPEENKIVMEETTKSFGLIVVNSEFQLSLKMENENSLVVERNIMTDVTRDNAQVVCHYRRK